MSQELILGNVYDLSKDIVGQFEPLNALELASAQERIETYLEKTLEPSEHQYWMLLCRELNDYTVFVAHPQYDLGFLAGEVIGCATDRGQVLDICLDDRGTAYEIWIKMSGTEEIHAYLLFPYGKAVIER